MKNKTKIKQTNVSLQEKNMTECVNANSKVKNTGNFKQPVILLKTLIIYKQLCITHRHNIYLNELIVYFLESYRFCLLTQPTQYLESQPHMQGISYFFLFVFQGCACFRFSS